MINMELVRRLFELALLEDVAFGDVTSETCVPPDLYGEGKVLAREELVVCGLPFVPTLIEVFGGSLQWNAEKNDGDTASEWTLLGKVTGKVQDILTVERTLLNFLQRMCGVATYTRSIVEKASPIVVLDTRKTTPGWRVLEKYATKIGGAKNHRMHLGEMILIKNNHIDAHGGSVEKLFSTLRHKKPWYVPVECEVRSIEELQAVFPYAPQVIMLDNMSDELILQALRLIKDILPSTLVEVSGGLTEARLERFKELGVPSVSMGRLTTQATNVDISLRMK